MKNETYSQSNEFGSIELPKQGWIYFSVLKLFCSRMHTCVKVASNLPRENTASEINVGHKPNNKHFPGQTKFSSRQYEHNLSSQPNRAS